MKVKEFFRKLMVSLKRNPQNISLVVLVATFLYYTLNLTKISDTTAKIQGPNMGLSGFVTMLFSILVFVALLNSFPKRKKPNYVMIGLSFVMFGAIIAADLNYRRCILNAYGQDGFADVVARNPYITQAETVVTVHSILVVVVVLLIALMPLYKKLLKKINTNIDLDYGKQMDAIEVED